MADISQSNWTEADASNSTAAPDGMPEGMAPSGVNDWGRAAAGAIKRWYNQTIPLVTGGTSTAYTLSYSVAPTALADGMTHLVQFNATNGAAPTLNVNTLGAKPLHFYAGGAWGACPANMFAVDQIVRVTYNSAAGTYRCIDTPMVLNQSVSGVTTIDFTGIPANVNHLEVIFDGTMGTNGASLLVQFYNSSGVLDSGSSSYTWNGTTINSSNGTAVAGATTTSIVLTGSASNSTSIGPSGSVLINNIQGVKFTQCTIASDWQNSDGVTANGFTGYGYRTAAGPITGVRILTSAGTFSGRATVRARG
jgi:hypothetical protein